MLRAEKAANGVQSGKGKQYLIKQANFTQADIDESISRLSKMTSVYDIGAEKLQKTEKKPSELFEEFFNSLGNKVYSETFGDIDLPKSSVKSEIRHGITSEKLASIEAIPDVIQQGKVISYTEKSGTDVKRIIIAAPITIASNPYYMGVMLQRDSQSQRLYLHNVAIIEETAPFSQADLLTTGALENDDRLYITNILRNAINVKINAERNLSGKQYSAKSSTSFRYSAKKPEIISGLQADYGYSEASANNIYRAARTLKQNTGSKADIEQLTSAIVTSLENRRNGDIDSKNIERIAMMLAENAQAVNETYVSEYQPIMDYLKAQK